MHQPHPPRLFPDAPPLTHVHRSGLSVMLPLAEPVHLVPTPLDRERQAVPRAGTLARDPFAGMAAASRAHDLDAFLRMAEAAQ